MSALSPGESPSGAGAGFSTGAELAAAGKGGERREGRREKGKGKKGRGKKRRGKKGRKEEESRSRPEQRCSCGAMRRCPGAGLAALAAVLLGARGGGGK